MKKQEIDTAQEPKKRKASTQQKRESGSGTRGQAGKKRWCEKSTRGGGSFCGSQSDCARCTYSAAELAAGLCAMYAFRHRTCYTSVRDIPIPPQNLLPKCGWCTYSVAELAVRVCAMYWFRHRTFCRNVCDVLIQAQDVLPRFATGCCRFLNTNNSMIE